MRVNAVPRATRDYRLKFTSGEANKLVENGCYTRCGAPAGSTMDVAI